MKIRLTREFSFEMAHALEGYDGACRQIHGHSYKMFVTIIGQPISEPSNPKLGMVMDFTQLKAIVNRLIVDRFDHSLVLRSTPQSDALIQSMLGKWDRIEVTPYQPTCENMIIDFVQMLQQELPPHIELVELKLYETERSSATWRKEDN